jgi:DNA-binding XRE family transcriptional regulator
MNAAPSKKVNWLKKVRTKLRLTQRTLGSQVGLSQTAINFVERNERELGEKHAHLLAKLIAKHNLRCRIPYRSQTLHYIIVKPVTVGINPKNV